MEHGEEKRKFVLSILDSIESRQPDWFHFIEIIAEPFLNNLSRPSNLIFSNQYEEQLVALNKIFNNDEEFSKLVDALKFLSMDASFSNSCVPGMVAFRLFSKFVDKLVQLVFKIMKESTSLEPLPSTGPISTLEVEAFIIHMRKLIQEYIKKGLRQGSTIWLARCSCIRHTFVQSCDIGEPPSIEMVLNNDSWQNVIDGEVSLRLADGAIKIFTFVESVVDKLIFKKSKQINCDSVLSYFFEPDNSHIVNEWHTLTKDFFSEIESLVFFRDLVKVIVNLSLRLEEGRLRGMEACERVQKYALRTDLKRNN